jgi:tetratricopeptide (TPR) repeat protein
MFFIFQKLEMGRVDSESGSIDEKYARAFHLLKSGRLGEARPLLDDLTKAKSEDPMIWIFSSFVSATLSQKSDAESSLKKAETLSTDDPLVWFNMGIVYKRLANSGRAKSMFSKAAKIDKIFKEKGKLAMKEDLPKLEFKIPRHIETIYESIASSDTEQPKISSAPIRDLAGEEEEHKIEELKKQGSGAVLRQVEHRVEYVKNILKKKSDSQTELEEALEVIDIACRLRPNHESAWAEKLLIFLALNRMEEANEHFKKYEFHKRDLANYENWRFYSVDQYFNALSLISEDNLEPLSEIYDAAGKYLPKEIHVLADADQEEPHLWFPILMNAIRKKNLDAAQKAIKILTSIMIKSSDRMRQIIEVARYLLDNKIAWLVINEDTSQFEIFWEWWTKRDTMKKNPSAYRGWAVLTRMFAENKQEDLAKFCYHMSRMVQELPEYRKGSLGESKIKPIPYDPNESATESIMGAITNFVAGHGGHPEYLADELEQQLQESKIPLGVGRLSDTMVRCPQCREMFTDWRPMTTKTVTVECPRCFKKISDPFQRKIVWK